MTKGKRARGIIRALEEGKTNVWRCEDCQHEFYEGEMGPELRCPVCGSHCVEPKEK